MMIKHPLHSQGPIEQQGLPEPHSTIGPPQLPITPLIPGVCGEGPWSWVSVLCRCQTWCSISSKHFCCLPQLPWAALAGSVPAQARFLQCRQVPALLPQVLPLVGQDLPSTDSLALSDPGWQSRQSWRFQELSEEVVLSCAAPCPHGARAGREGRAVPGGLQGAVLGQRHRQSSLPTDTLGIQAHPRADRAVVFHFPQSCPGKHSLVISGALRFDREGWAAALPWVGHTHQQSPLPLSLAEEQHLLLLG